MKQLLRKGLKNIVVDEVPDPVVTPHHVIVCPHCSLISSGTETASIHRGGALGAVAENPSYIGKILDVMKNEGPRPHDSRSPCETQRICGPGIFRRGRRCR